LKAIENKLDGLLGTGGASSELLCEPCFVVFEHLSVLKRDPAV
jgi:hypothetical protein